MSRQDVAFVYTNSNTQGRLGTHAFDLVYPPLGLAYLSAVLEKAGYSVAILDASAERLSTDETLGRLRRKFKIVGFYCHTQNYPLIAEMAAALKKDDPELHLIMGGPHATAVPAECLEHAPEMEAVAFGEGEETILEMVPKLLAGESLKGVRGIWYRDEKGIHPNDGRPQIDDLDGLPMPAWHLLPMHRYQSFIESGGKKALHLIGSRGCFSDCNYCFSTKMWGPTARWHSADRVLAEMDHLQSEYGIKFFQFFDDNFTLDIPRLRKLMPAFIERGWGDDWVCSTRIDLLNRETVELLAEGQVHHIAIGMETVNDRLLKVINKKVTKKQTIEALRLCDEHGVKVMGMFIIGLPSETKEETQETLEFVKASNLYLAVFSHLTVYPGTNFWPMLKDSPYLDKDFRNYSLAKNFSYIEPPRTLAELEGLMSKAYLNFYTRPRVVATLTGMMLRNPAKIVEVGVGFSKVLLSLFTGAKAQPKVQITHG